METPIWRQSGSDACYYGNKSHGLTLPRLPALLLQCPFSDLSFVISFPFPTNVRYLGGSTAAVGTDTEEVLCQL